MKNLTHGERVLLGRIGAYTMLSRHDPKEVTSKARAAFESKFERDVDPEGILPIEERLCRAEMARKAHYARLAGTLLARRPRLARTTGT